MRGNCNTLPEERAGNNELVAVRMAQEVKPKSLGGAAQHAATCPEQQAATHQNILPD